MTLKPTIKENLSSLKSVHPNFVCIHGFFNIQEETKSRNVNTGMNYRVQEYNLKNTKIGLEDLLTTFSQVNRKKQIEILFFYICFYNTHRLMMGQEWFQLINLKNLLR